MNHLQNTLYRLKNSATTASQQLIIGEVSQEILRIVDAYDRIEKTLKSTQEAAFWLLKSLKTSANTQVSMFTQNKILALRDALDKAGYTENEICTRLGRDVTKGVSPIGVAQLPVAPPVPIENAKLPVPQPMNLSAQTKHKVMEGFDRSKYTPEQWEWCVKYERETSFDPMMEDFEAGNKTFVEAAQFACTWYEDHSSDAHRRITQAIPGEWS